MTFSVVLLAFVALVGFFASYRIYHAKKKKAPLACPRTSRCDMIIHSTYSKTFGMHNDVLGIIYYALVLLLSIPLFIYPIVFWWFATLVTIGFLFSLYLVGVQIFVFRSWCLWCVLSALSSTTLFLILVCAF